MKELIGFWVMCLAVNIAIVGVTGFDLSVKDKILMIVCFQVFISLLEIGLLLMM